MNDNTINLGKLIRTLRKHRHLTQEKLAEGICSRRQLINIESGRTIPSTYTLDRLVQKLNIDNFFTLLQFSAYEDPLNVYENYKHMESLRYYQDYDSLRKYISDMKLKKHEEITPLENILSWYEGICYYHIDQDYDKSLLLFKQALHVKSLEISSLPPYLGKLDLEILNSAALCLYHAKDSLKATNFLSFIDSYIDQIQLNENYHEFQVKVVYNLSNILSELSRYNESLHYIDKGIDLSLSINSITFLGQLYYQKAENLFFLDKAADIKDYLVKSYFLFDLKNNIQLKNIVLEKSKTKFNICLFSSLDGNYDL